MTRLYFKDGTTLQFPEVDSGECDWVEPFTLELMVGEIKAGCFVLDGLRGWYTDPEKKEAE